MTGMVVAGLPPQRETGAGEGLNAGVGAAGLAVGGTVGEGSVGVGDDVGEVEGTSVGTAASLGGGEPAMGEDDGDEELHPATRATTARTTRTR